MSGGIHTYDRSYLPDLCPWCDRPLHVESQEWTGGPTGFTAHVDCHGCDLRGPCVPYVYPTEAEARDLAVRLWRREEAAMKEFKEAR